MVPPYARQALHSARTLPQLQSAAQRVGLGKALEQPCAPLAADPALGPDLAAFLARVIQDGKARTLADLVAPGRMQGMVGSAPRPWRDKLLDAIRARIESLLDPPSPPPAPHAATAASATRPAAPRGPARPAASSTAPAGAPSDQRALRDWAREHGVEPVLGEALDGLMPQMPMPLRRGLRRWGFGVNVGQVVASEDALPRRLRSEAGIHGIRAVRETAWAYLKQASREAAEERAREAAERALPDPDDPTLRALVEKLRHARERHRRKGQIAMPVRNPRLAFHATPPALSVRLDEGAEVVVPLDEWETAPLTAHHPGGAFGTGDGPVCLHIVPALDAAIRFLRTQPPSDVARAVAETLKKPRWARALAVLAEVRRRHDRRRRPAEETQLSWRLTLSQNKMSLYPVLHRRTKRGAWSTGSRMRVAELARAPELCPLPADRKAVQLVAEGERGYPDRDLRSYRALSAVLALAGHPRLFVQRERELVPVAVHEARFGLALVPDKDGGLAFAVAADGEPLDLRSLDIARGRGPAGELRGWVDLERRRSTVVRVSDEADELLDRLAALKQVFPPESHDELVAFAATLEPHLPVALPPALRGDEVPDDRTLVVRLHPLDGAALRLDVAVRPLSGGPHFAPGQGPAEVLGAAGGRRVFARRDRAAEVERARILVAELSLRPDAEDPAFVYTLDRGDEALDAAAALARRREPGLVVEWDRAAWTVSRPVKLADVRVEIGRRRDWFGLSGTATVDGATLEVARLLDAVRRRRRYVELSPGNFVALDRELRARLQPAADQAFEDHGQLAVGPAAALALDEVAGELGGFETDAGFAQVLDRLRAARTFEPEAPEEIRAKLREYQHQGFRWLARLAAWGAGACLADDMGLGKTIQALALLVHRAAAGPALVVAPTSVGRNWTVEAARFAPSLKVRLYREIADADRSATVAAAGPGEVLVASWGLLVRDRERLAARTWATAVFDEAQAMKNAATRRAQAGRQLQADFRVALTGTPLENHLGELWSLYRVVFPGLLGSWEQFRDRFAGPIEREGDAERRGALARLIRPFLLRRTKAEVAPELPARTEIVDAVELSPGERRLYEQARLAAVALLTGIGSEADDEQRRFEVLAALTRLRLCACHPRLYDQTSSLPSAKLGRLMEIVEELRAEGHRALVFSQFTRHLALVREELDRRGFAYLYLDGQTPAPKRDELVDSFQAGRGGGLFLISLKAGGTGLNLTAASYVVHLDPWWNPAVEDQASDRAHRIGQDKPVTVVRLVSHGTVEEQILELHEDKRALVAGILEGTGGAAKLSTGDLIALIRSGPAPGEETAEEPIGDDEPGPPAVEIGASEGGARSAEPEAAAAGRPQPRGDGSSTPASSQGPSEPGPRGAPPEGHRKTARPIDGASVPDCLGGSAEGVRDLVDGFAAAIRAERLAGRLTTDGPEKSYTRALWRFAEYAATRVAAGADRGASLDELVRAYLAALADGSVEAPKSEPVVARAALRRLEQFLSA